jgi:hypothetical protein
MYVIRGCSWLLPITSYTALSRQPAILHLIVPTPCRACDIVALSYAGRERDGVNHRYTSSTDAYSL